MTYGAVPYASSPIGGLSSLLTSEILQYALRIYYRNILEGATITVSSENLSYPKYRLYDRNIGLLFKGNSTPSAFQIKVDQGDNPIQPEIDTVIVGDSHNLTGLALRLYKSTDGVSYYQVVAWTGESGLIKKSFDPTRSRYWMFQIDNPTTAPELAELFLTKEYVFERNPSYGYETGEQKNITRIESRAGLIQKTKWGEKRKLRRYSLTKIGTSQKADLELFDLETEGVKSFFIEDIEGNFFFAELREGLPPFRAERANRWGLTLDVLEVLP